MISPIEEKLDRILGPMCATLGWSFHRQVRFGRYTADFMITTNERSFIIEADGHAFHDRTDEQATKDRARDRWFLRLGLITVRLSSSEIFANAEACSTEIVRTIYSYEEHFRRIAAEIAEAG